VDVLNATVERDRVKKPVTRVTARTTDPDKVDEILSMMASAKNPVIIAGSGVWQSKAEEALVKFIENTGMPVFTSLSGRGTVPDSHPLCFEGALAIRPGGAFAAYLETDLVILLGTRVCLYYMFGEVFNPAAKKIQVDICEEEIGRNMSVDLPVVSDLKALLRNLNQKIGENGMSEKYQDRFSAWIDKLHQADKDGKAPTAADWNSNNVPIHPLRLTKEIDAFMNQETDIIVADGGDTTTWMGMTRTMIQSGHYLDYGIYGSLGVGIPYANTAKLRYPDKRVLLITGDGSFGFNFMEIENAIRKQIPLVVVICNDLGWGMIRHSQEIRIGHAIEAGTLIGRINYHKLVEALGGFGMLVEKPGDIRPALEAAFASGKTACINVMTDPTTVSPGSMALANVGAYKA